MNKAACKDFNKPDEVREFENGHLELIEIGEGVVGKLTLQPGWKWSNDVKPIAKTKSCEEPHFQYQLSGKLHIAMDDGTVFETKSGDVCWLPSGHDAWVIGDEPVVLIDWSGAMHYAEIKEDKASAM